MILLPSWTAFSSWWRPWWCWLVSVRWWWFLIRIEPGYKWQNCKLKLKTIFHFQMILKHRINKIWERIHHLVLMWVVGGNKRHWYLINPSNESESSGDYSLGWPDQVRLWSLHLTFQDNKKLLAQSPTPPPIVKSKQIPFIASTANISHIPSFV